METVTLAGGHAIRVPEGWTVTESGDTAMMVLMPVGLERFAGHGFVPIVAVNLATTGEESAWVDRAGSRCLLWSSRRVGDVCVRQSSALWLTEAMVAVCEVDMELSMAGGGAFAGVSCQAAVTDWVDVGRDFDMILDQAGSWRPGKEAIP